MKFYLKVKHWQLFIVLAGALFLGQALALNSTMRTMSPGTSTLTFATFIVGLLFFGWLWSVASASSKALSPELRSSPNPMKLGIIYALTYMLFGQGLVFGSGSQIPVYGVVMHLLAITAIFYSFGFTAKQLTKLEQGRDVSFFSYSGPFFLFWFFPIGVWFIQPKVNELLGEEKR